jgi:hypothetical protein
MFSMLIPMIIYVVVGDLEFIYLSLLIIIINTHFPASTSAF